MNSKIEYALIWKEVRQSGPIVAAFCLMSLIIVAYLSWLHNYSPQRMVQYTLPRISEMLHYFVFFISLGLAYMMAAGNRVLEANDNLEAFLFVRPIERFTLLRVYYFVGLAGVVVWFVVFFLLVYLFFGSEIFAVAIDPTLGGMNVNVILCLIALITAHATSFCIALVSPSLITTSVGYIGSYISVMAVFFVSMQENSRGAYKLLEETLLQIFIPTISLGLLAALVTLTIVYYQKKQVR